MRYSAVFSALLAAAAVAPVLSLPVGIWAREADDEVLYERDLDIVARGPPRPLPPRPLPKPPPRPLPKPPKRRSADDLLYERDIENDIFWARDIIARGPPRPLPPRPLPKPPPRPLPKPPKRRSAYDDAMDVLAREYEDELFARWMEVDELD